MNKKYQYLLWFKEIDKDDLPLVGGKGANLGEMTKMGIPVPNGFVVTTRAYYDFIKTNGLKPKIQKILDKVNYDDQSSLAKSAQEIKNLIIKGKIPRETSQGIINSYLKLGGLFSQALVAVRSSATAEDLPTASFAGQQRTFLNIKGEANVVQSVRACWASLFEARAIFYRHHHGFDHFKVGLAVPVQEMIASKTSGICFTADPVSGQKDKIVIEAIWGLGELIVQGAISPDRYIVLKKDFTILERHLEKQTIQLIKVGALNKETNVPKNLQLRRKLNDDQIHRLAVLAEKIHRHYYFPQDIEWAVLKNNIYILQTRPITTLNDKPPKNKNVSIFSRRKVLLQGVPASPGIAAGSVKIIKSAKEIGRAREGDILVTEMTTPDFVPAMKKVAGIVTDKGGQTSHAAIVSRELGLPCIVGTKTATKVLDNGWIITLDGAKGKIYKGGLGESKPQISPQTPGLETRQPVIKTATKIYVNLADPDSAESIAAQNVDGVGLLRAEFMISNLGVHPKKLIKDGKGKAFVDQLASGIEKICRAFAPRPVVYRSTDFKTNEYRNLTGGKAFEPQEENPFIGYRGAFRYLADPQTFELELKAIKKVRTKAKLTNLSLMIPFCRTPQELVKVKRIINAEGLTRSASFKLWLMVEIPTNIIRLEEFLNVGIDGLSIGSNDLTMLLLGVDRDNSALSAIFSENDPSVLWAIERTIKEAHKNKVTVSICGQAPSVYPDFVEKLVDWGIDSFSLNPDALSSVREIVYEREKKLIYGQSTKNRG